MIYLDMTSIIEATEKTDIVSFLKRNVTQELITAYPKLEVQEVFSPHWLMQKLLQAIDLL